MCMLKKIRLYLTSYAAMSTKIECKTESWILYVTLLGVSKASALQLSICYNVQRYSFNKQALRETHIYHTQARHLQVAKCPIRQSIASNLK